MHTTTRLHGVHIDIHVCACECAHKHAPIHCAHIPMHIYANVHASDPKTSRDSGGLEGMCLSCRCSGVGPGPVRCGRGESQQFRSCSAPPGNPKTVTTPCRDPNLQEGTHGSGGMWPRVGGPQSVPRQCMASLIHIRPLSPLPLSNQK